MKWFQNSRKKEPPGAHSGESLAGTEKGELCARIAEEAEKRRAQRLPFELQWRLNANFLLGNQHCDINVHRMSVENYKPLYDYMSCEVFNRIAPIMETRLAHITSIDYHMKVDEKDESMKEHEKAEKLTAYLENRQNSRAFAGAFSRMTGLCEQTGSAFFLCWWNEDKKDADMTVLSPYEVLPEDLYKEDLSSQRSIIIEQIKTVGEIKDLYGVSLKEEQVSAYGLKQVDGAGGYGYESAAASFVPVEKKNCVILRTYMEKPTCENREGLLIITAGSEILYRGDLPGRDYPLCHVKSKCVSGQFFGKSVIENLIPLQRSYNGIKNRINDFINRSTNGQLLIEDGSVDADDLCERGLVPGEPVIYRRGARLPEMLKDPPLSEMAPAQCKQLSDDMEYAAGVSGLMSGTALPSGIRSGAAIESLKWIDRIRLSICTGNIRQGLRTLALLWFSMHTLYNGGRISVKDEGKEPALAGFEEGQLRFVCENEPKQTNEEKRAVLAQAVEMKLFDASGGSGIPDMQRRYLLRRFFGIDAAQSEEELQLQNAEQEQSAFEKGETPCRTAFDDDELHLRAHRLYVLHPAFRRLLEEDSEKAGRMIAHISEHEANAAGKRAEQNEGKEKANG